ncbi:DUF1819 family protein [Alkalibacillus haloalkaliphilus]|uniref:DUF1819 family protein n=1 Tax=Alkalibacillus haloalkaliphilus TaxID=94136 RepID=UPI0029363BFC|nr:DUF1819 family protein [Alkalibacillus haloalkaliphilus]MDV2581663.1 DUF1819 family protein [Alkalibacillus haloalkaliphilus]
MSQELEYSAALTGASFLFFELKKVVSLSLEGQTDKEIKQKVIEENLFDYKFVSSLKRSTPALLKRNNVLDEKLKEMLLNEDLQTAKVIVLYAIMKTDRLFYEWMTEVIGEKLRNNDFYLEKIDSNLFFEHKAEQSEKVASFKEQTRRKLQTIHQKIMLESGILLEKKTGTLSIPLIDEELRDHLISIGDKKILQAVGYEEGA